MRELLDRYCEFAGCGRQHVVYEALRFTFQQDSDFQRWLESHGETSQQSGADWNLKDKPA